jgi:hypothetical protein
VVALNEGLRVKKALWRQAGRQELESFALAVVFPLQELQSDTPFVVLGGWSNFNDLQS